MRGSGRSGFSLLLSLVLTLLAGGCYPARSVPAAVDPAAQATEALTQCGGLTPDARTTCLEERLVSLVEQSGVETAMETLSRLADLNADIRRDGHVFAHAIGIAAYTSPDEAGSVFGRCNPSFQSGCYHGVIQAYFIDLSRPDSQRTLDADAVNDLCAEHYANRWLLFQCVHGLGHGLTMFYGHDLRLALAGCDLLEDDWSRESCYGGAFMENVVNATMPHHPASRSPADSTQTAHADHHGPAQADAHAHHGPAGAQGGHTHHAAGDSDSPESPPFRALDPEDPHYPCNVLGERYLTACYQMQTSAVLFFNHGDFAATAAVCDGAPESVRHTCYQSLGRDINSYALQNHAATIRHCAVGDPRYQPWCYVGVVKNLVDLTARSEDGMAYCRAVPDDRNKQACYEAVGEQIWVLEQETTRRDELCGQAEAEYVRFCRAGAGLAPRQAAQPGPE